MTTGFILRLLKMVPGKVLTAATSSHPPRPESRKEGSFTSFPNRPESIVLQPLWLYPLLLQSLGLKRCGAVIVQA